MLRTLVDRGVRLIDTADAYCLTSADTGHNEDLVAEAIGGRDDVVVATKGGHVRDATGGWHTDGRPAHLRAACEESLRRLGRDAIDLYFFHRPDPAVPFEESVGAMRELRDAGKVRHVGVSNVDVAQLDAASAIVEVAAVQNELSPDVPEGIDVLRACAARAHPVPRVGPARRWRRRGPGRAPPGPRCGGGATRLQPAADRHRLAAQPRPAVRADPRRAAPLHGGGQPRRRRPRAVGGRSRRSRALAGGRLSAGALVILAAGLGRRFGGPKPFVPVGPAGEAIVDYTLFDAAAAGFDPLIVVVREATHDIAATHLGARDLDVVLVVQDADRSVPPRELPWGTVHAVVACRAVIPGGFAVVNGDDLYGRAPLELLVRAAAVEPDLHHLVAHRWSRTMPPSGTANRGVVDVAPDGHLRTIREVRGLDAASELAPDALVSMNVWRFAPVAMDLLGDALERFVVDHPDDELPLPVAIGDLVDRDEIAVRVHATDAAWVGITYPDDLATVRRGLTGLVSSGAYPSPLR